MTKGVKDYKESPMLSRNFMNFGPQTPKNRTEVFNQRLYSALSFVARLCTRMSANKTQPNFAIRQAGDKSR